MDGNNLRDQNSTIIDNNRFGDFSPRGRFIGANKNLHIGLQSKIFTMVFFSQIWSCYLSGHNDPHYTAGVFTVGSRNLSRTISAGNYLYKRVRFDNNLNCQTTHTHTHTH